jgi:hypothetical protein
MFPSMLNSCIDGIIWCNWCGFRCFAFVKLEKNPWPSYVSELYQPSVRRLSAKLVPKFADRGWSAQWIPTAVLIGYLGQSRYSFFQVVPQFYLRGWVAPFQKYYFAENLVAPGIEPGPLDIYPETLTIEAVTWEHSESTSTAHRPQGSPWFISERPVAHYSNSQADQNMFKSNVC